MQGVPSENDIVSESMRHNALHSLTGVEKSDTFDRGGGQFSVANSKFVAKESPWQKALLRGDIADAHRIIRAAMNLAEPSTPEIKHEMAKQFFRQLNHLSLKTGDEFEKQRIQQVSTALETDPELKRAKNEVEQEGRKPVSEPTTEPASEISTPRTNRSDSFKATPERGQTPVQGAEDGKRYLEVVPEKSKYSPFMNAVLASEAAKEGAMFVTIKKELGDEGVSRAADQLADHIDFVVQNKTDTKKRILGIIKNLKIEGLLEAVQKKLL